MPKAIEEGQDERRQSDDVEVHHTRGCPLCWRRDRHYHSQTAWRKMIDAVGRTMGL